MNIIRHIEAVVLLVAKEDPKSNDVILNSIGVGASTVHSRTFLLGSNEIFGPSLSWKKSCKWSNQIGRINPIQSEGGGWELLKPPLPKVCPHALNFGATLLCVEDFSPKHSFTSCGEGTNFDWGSKFSRKGDLKF